MSVKNYKNKNIYIFWADESVKEIKEKLKKGDVANLTKSAISGGFDLFYTVPSQRDIDIRDQAGRWPANKFENLATELKVSQEALARTLDVVRKSGPEKKKSIFSKFFSKKK